MTTALGNRELRERWQLVTEIEKLEAEHLKELPGLDAAVDAAADAEASAKVGLKEAVASHRTACFDRTTAAVRHGHQRDLLEGQLRSSAPSEVGEFIAELRVESERLRRSRLGDGKGQVSNREAVVARVQALGAAQREAEALRLRALSHEELAAELGRIRDGIPRMDAAS